MIHFMASRSWFQRRPIQEKYSASAKFSVIIVIILHLLFACA
jgi:hypothetical protein